MKEIREHQSRIVYFLVSQPFAFLIIIFLFFSLVTVGETMMLRDTSASSPIASTHHWVIVGGALCIRSVTISVCAPEHNRARRGTPPSLQSVCEIVDGLMRVTRKKRQQRNQKENIKVDFRCQSLQSKTTNSAGLTIIHSTLDRLFQVQKEHLSDSRSGNRWRQSVPSKHTYTAGCRSSSVAFRHASNREYQSSRAAQAQEARISKELEGWTVATPT